MIFFASLTYLAVVGAVIYIAYRVIDNWISRIIAVRKEQNEALREIASALRERNGGSSSTQYQH